MRNEEAYRLPDSGDRWTEDYERGRPGWPLEIFAHLRIPSTATVLEVGAGTGKLSRLLTSRFDRVLAVEPQAGMRAQLVRLVPRAEVIDAIAEQLPLQDSSMDAVFVAEAFHKFDSRASVRELARVLRPGGHLALLWNVPSGPPSPPIDGVERLIDSLLAERDLTEEKLGHAPADLHPATVKSGAWRAAFDDTPFGPLHQRRLRHEDVVDSDGVVAFLASMGWIADLATEQRQSVLDRIRSLLDADRYHRLWDTYLYWTRSLPTTAEVRRRP